MLDVARGDSCVALTINENPKGSQAKLKVGLEWVPNPTLDGLQRRDPIRRQSAVTEFSAAVLDPRAELEVLTTEMLDMALGDSGVAFTINEDS